MFFLKNLDSKDIKIVSDEKNLNNINFDEWSQDEINSIGKIGFNSKSFVEDDEEYFKW